MGTKSKPPGLMTWSEAYAVWSAIQRSKRQAADDDKTWKLNVLNRSRTFDLQFIKAEIRAFMDRMMQRTEVALALLGNITAKPLLILTETLKATTDFIKGEVRSLTGLLIDITDKLTVILGEQKKLLQDFLLNWADSWKTLLAKARIAEMFIAIQEFLKKELRELISQQLDKLKRRFTVFMEPLTKQAINLIQRFFSKSKSPSIVVPQNRSDPKFKNL